MIPKLTDDAVSRLPLEAGRAELLEEIMSTVAPDRTVSEPTPESTRRRQRWLVPLAAAAVVAGIAGSSLALQQASHESGRGGDGTSQVADQLDLPRGDGILLDAPNWTVDHLSGDGLLFRNSDAELEITSYDAKSYDSYVKDREHIVDPPAPGEPLEVLGRSAQMWAYTPTDHTAIREVEDGHWLELRGSGMDKAGYLALLGQLRFASQAEFEAALPKEFVGEGERAFAGQQIVDEITAVSGAGFPRGESLRLRGDDAKDRYQFGAEVAGAYACAWLEEFEKASNAGQDARAAEAARVLDTSGQWPILLEMNAEGDYPEVVWEYAIQAASGQVPDGYREGLGCP
jgi:hypothetical protein